MLGDNTGQAFTVSNGDVNGFLWMDARVQNAGFIINVIAAMMSEISDNGMPVYEYIKYIDNDANLSFGVFLNSENSTDQLIEFAQSWNKNKAYGVYVRSNDTFQNVFVCYLNEDERKPIINNFTLADCKSIKYDPSKGLEKQTELPDYYIFGYNNFTTVDQLFVGDDLCISLGGADSLYTFDNSVRGFLPGKQLNNCATRDFITIASVYFHWKRHFNETLGYDFLEYNDDVA